MEGCSDHQSLIAQQTGLECVMGVWQSGHACFSLHHSVIQFLHRAHQTGKNRHRGKGAFEKLKKMQVYNTRIIHDHGKQLLGVVTCRLLRQLLTPLIAWELGLQNGKWIFANAICYEILGREVFCKRNNTHGATQYLCK